MKTTLTDRILAILSDKPIASVDVWDALGDSGLRQYDVTNELQSMRHDGLVKPVLIVKGRLGYVRAAQAVAS